MITYNDKPAPKPTRVAIVAKPYPGGYRPLIIWYVNGRQTHQYIVGIDVHKTIDSALEAAHGTLMADTDGIHSLRPPKANRVSISYKISNEDKQ